VWRLRSGGDRRDEPFDPSTYRECGALALVG
jgi:hypothetical protein